MSRAALVILLLSIPLAACGVPAEEHQRALRELDEATVALQEADRRIAALEAEVAELRESDEAYWRSALELKSAEQWSEVHSKVSQLLERWPNSQYAPQARRLIREATEAMADRLYERARSELDSERFEAARSTLTQIRDEYAGTSAHSRAVVDLRGIDGEIELARRRAVGSGKWRVSSQVSPIDDSTNVYLSLYADDTFPDRFGEQVRPTLILRCKENRTEIFVTWDVYLGIDTTRVLHRLDSRPAQTKSWSISTDHEATFYSGSHISFARQLMEHEHLLLQTTPYGESPVTVTFSIAGLENAAVPLREACGW